MSQMNAITRAIKPMKRTHWPPAELEILRTCYPHTRTEDLLPILQGRTIKTIQQKVASPVWMDIDPSDTLQYASACEHDDERHICPLQLEVIRRGVELWTNPGDVVLSPFAWIGSEGYVSLQMGRKFIGAELKDSYYKQASRNLQRALLGNMSLFDSEAV